MKVKVYILSVTILLSVVYKIPVFAQDNNSTKSLPIYSFINYQNNMLQLPFENSGFQNFFAQMDTLLYEGKGTINIVHIGASHVQADQLSGRFRENLYNFVPGLISNRGILFPYTIAKSNHPFNYYSTFTGNWTSCRNVESKKICNLGVSGIAVSTNDTISEINFYFRKNNYPEFRFNTIKVLHATGENYYDIELLLSDTVECWKESFEGYTIFKTKELLDTISLRIIKTDSLQNSFELYGVVAGIDAYNGFTYHSIGVNGATVNSFLRCNLFKDHLNHLSPDLVILSLGINDVQGKDFSSDDFERNYDLLIKQIREVNPDVCIILTSNSDSYYKRKYPNSNSILARSVVLKLLEKNENIAFWDWFEIMGGLGVVKKWEKQNLVKKDLIHFTKDGYFVLGDLFFDAFIKSFNYYLINKE